MIEVEVKAWVPRPAEVQRRVLELKAAPLGRRVEHDTYYRHPVRDFATTDEALRLRRVVRITDEGEVDWRSLPAEAWASGRTFVTYKGPRMEGTAKTRTEEEVLVQGNVHALLGHLGFSAVQDVLKHRRAWSVGDAVITLDEVDGLGVFVEVEVMVHSEAAAGDPEALRRAGREASNLLSRLGLYDIEEKSYLELVLERRERRVRA
ncbi:MAG: class IV adenylate cyclase [Euryarchaeota archaeon]|nr:class IV adenylate cyclase [Euryarchaeota archaeon]